MFGGRAIATPGVQQSLALAPGRHAMHASADNQTDAQRPFAWRISCREGTELLVLPLATSPGWHPVEADFVVPTGCPGQVLRLELLARSIAERQVSGTLRVDDVRIRRR